MEWTEKQILDTLRFIEESDYDEVRLETGNLKLHVRKSGAPASIPPEEGVRSPSLERPPDAVAKKDEPGPDADRAIEGRVPAGMVAVRSPIVGTFYRAPAPHLPPFVDVHAQVGP